MGEPFCDNPESYEAYMAEMEKEHQAELAAGGRSICPKCGERSVVTRTVLTYGVASNHNSEYSALYECENCDYKDL